MAKFAIKIMQALQNCFCIPAMIWKESQQIPN